MPCRPRPTHGDDANDDEEDHAAGSPTNSVLTKFDTLSNILVGSGNLALNDSKKSTNFGMTNVGQNDDDTTAITATTAGIDHR